MSTEHVSNNRSSRRVLSLCAGILVPFLMTSAQAQTWVSTATRALALNNAVATGPLDANAPVHIAVALKVHNMDQLKAAIQRMGTPGDSMYGTSLTPAQFTATYGPTTSDASAVKNYLASQGFRNIQVEDNRMFVTADGTAQQAQMAFNTALTQFVLDGKTVYANTLAAQVPASLGSTVLSVLGLNNIVAMHTNLVHRGTAAPSVPDLTRSAYGPKDFQKAYDVGTLPSGSKTAIAIFAEGNLQPVLTDLRAFEAANNLSKVYVTMIKTGIASPDTAGVDEWDLDSQSSTGIAAFVQHLYFYDATSLTDSDLAIAFNRFAAQNLAQAGNASFGECEVFAWADGSMVADDQVFAEAAAQGQTVFSSTGDVGASCPLAPTNGVPDSGPVMTSYPASSPYVVAVGGTDMFTNTDGTWNNEVVWNGSGGGVSALEYSMFWQSGAVPTNAAAARGIPDIAMCADPNTCGAILVVNGQQEIVGGTSLSSPLAMGAWARLMTRHGNRLGFAAPVLYRLAKGVNTSSPALPSVTGFHDIIVGTNGGYVATPGWDYTTGLGSFDIAAVSNLLQ